jgi:plastocyanin
VLAAAAVVTLAALVPLQNPSAPGSESSGKLEGTARLSPRLTAMRLRVRIYSEPGDPGAPDATPTNVNAFANVVLFLEDAASLRGAADAVLPVMRQHDERFTPHVLAVTAGTTVAFPNDDAIYHNVFSLSRTRTFDLGRYPKGESKSVRFGVPGVVQVFCHIHADMNGYILVLPNRYFTIPDSTGRFAIGGVPPGEYRLVAWHERIRPIVTTVRVDAGRTTTLELSIPLVESKR